MFEQLFAELEKISDREVELSNKDNRLIPDLIRARQTDNFRFKFQSSLRQMSSPSAPQTPGASTQTNRQSFNRRNPSGAGSGLTSSSNDNSTYRDSINLGDTL